MTPLFSKLNLNGQGAVTVLNAPSSFDEELTALKALKSGETALAKHLSYCHS